MRVSLVIMGAGLFAAAAFGCSAARAQDLPDNVIVNATSGVPASTVDAEEAAALSNEEVEKALANAIRQSLNQQEEAEDAATEEDDEGETKKKYRYEKKDGPFSEGQLPKRTFNNIDYPY